MNNDGMNEDMRVALDATAAFEALVDAARRVLRFDGVDERLFREALAELREAVDPFLP